MSGAACIIRWPGDDPFSVLRETALAEERLEHRRLRLLELQEQWVAVVAAEQKQDPGPGADAPDADHLTRGVNVAIALEELPPIG